MSRPSKIRKNNVGAMNGGESASEVIDLTAAAASLECQSALVEGPAAARAALAKHRASSAPNLVQALETVGSYTTNEHGRTLLHEALVNGDATTVKTLIVAGAMLIDPNGATLIALATDGTCRDILNHQAAVHAVVTEDPAKLVAAALAHCATLSGSGAPLSATTLSLRAYHFDPCFLWAPPAARTAVVAWALHVLIAQLAATTQPFGRLRDDPAGDVLEFFGVAHKESELIPTHCSSPEARAWVGAVIAAAVVATATAELVPAARHGDLVSVQDCLSKMANVETKLANGMTALIWASEGGHTPTVQHLLEAGADKEAKDKDGYSALIVASRNGHTDTVQLLVQTGADKEARNYRGSTALMGASYYGHAATVQLLLEAGADKDAKDDFHQSSLLRAAGNGHTATVQLLLEAGADKEAVDRAGRTALFWANQRGHTEVEALLQNSGN